MMWCENCKTQAQEHLQCCSLSSEQNLKHLTSDMPWSSLAAVQWKTKLLPGNTWKMKLSNINGFVWINENITNSISIITWHCPGGIMPDEGSVLKCGNLRKRKLTGSFGQIFCRMHDRDERWLIKQGGNSNWSDGLGTRDTGRPEPVTASSTLLLPTKKKIFVNKSISEL